MWKEPFKFTIEILVVRIGSLGSGLCGCVPIPDSFFKS